MTDRQTERPISRHSLEGKTPDISFVEEFEDCGVAFERMINFDKLKVLRGILDEIQAYVNTMPLTVLDVPSW